MALRRLEPEDWKPYFDGLAHRLHASRVDVRVDALDVGDQAEVERMPLESISFDERDRCISLAFEKLHHRLGDIAEVWIDERDQVLRTLCVTHPDGRLDVVDLTPVEELGQSRPS